MKITKIQVNCSNIPQLCIHQGYKENILERLQLKIKVTENNINISKPLLNVDKQVIIVINIISRLQNYK